MSSSALADGLRHLRGQLAAQQHHDDSDEQLLHAFLASRDDSAFAALVRGHGPMVLHVCRRVLGHQQDAEDAFQATFLVLARQAAKLRKKASVASWLHRIAHRVAGKAKRAAARRRKHEGRAPARPSAEPSAALLWDDVRALLDAEIGRLPEKYRSVFVLFYLEDCGREEVARRLGLKEGTVASRLAEARKRLQRQLSRRGVELTALLAASALASALPPRLVANTVHAALGEGTEGLVSAQVAGLAKGTTSALMLSKMKLSAVILLAGGLLGGAGLWLSAPPQEGGPARPARPTAVGAAPLVAPSTAKTATIEGRVLAPDGKPKSGAKLLLLDYNDKKITEIGISEADGRFAVAVPKETKDHSLIAQADGTGIDFRNLRDWKPATPIELRLVKDQAIRGRIVNTEGKPIAGVRVAINSINTYPDNSLDSFLALWKQRDLYSQIPWGENTFWSPAKRLLPTTTDADGRFALHGAGAERLVSLRLHGAGIAETVLWIANREGFDPEPYNQATRRNIPKEFTIAHRWVLHGPNLSIVADAEKPIRGSVKDADTGKGRANVVVHLTCEDAEQHQAVQLQAATDAAGRYEMHGVHKAKSYLLEVGSDATVGYMPCQVSANDTPGYDPVEVDIRVKKGVIVTGKVIDHATGKILPGFAMAEALVGNSFAKTYPRFNASRIGNLDYYAAEDGTFRLVTVPGPVLLMGGLEYGRLPNGRAELMKYKPWTPDPQYPQYFTPIPGFKVGFLNWESNASVVQGNFCKVLQIKPGADVVKQDIVLERASALPVIVRDGEGRPLRGTWGMGLGSEPWRGAVKIDTDSCAAYHLEASKPRLMVFYHPERKLAGSLVLKGDEKPPVAVKLGPAASIKGRLVDADGKPLAGAVVEVGYRDREASEIYLVIHKAKQVVTDAEGAFAFDELIPERKFSVQAIRRGKRLVEEGSKPRDPVVHEVKPDECRDLGTLKLKLNE